MRRGEMERKFSKDEAVQVLINGANFWAIASQKGMLGCLARTKELDCDKWCVDRGICLKLQKLLRRGR